LKNRQVFAIVQATQTRLVTVMAEEHSPIDISGIPELLRIVEDVQLTRRPRVLTRGSKDVAVVVPVPVKAKRGRGRADDREAVLGTAGSWKGLVDADELKAQLASGRGSNRSPADL
jgi:hypothetical protein